MKRRLLVQWTAASLVGGPAGVARLGAQPAGKVPRIGVLRFGVPDDDAQPAFMAALAAIGYHDGKTIQVDWRWATRADVARRHAVELAGLGLDLIVASATPAALALRDAKPAAPIILATGQPVMALGGFSGGDPILSVQQLAERVRKNDVRFFLLPTQAGQQADLIRWVSGNCRPVPPNLWQAGPPGRGQVPNPGPEGTLQLYDCAR